jgi:hypothetical protein
MLKPIQFNNFGGGLNLRDKADVVTDAEAIDLLNVDFTDVGAIRQRDGTALFTPSALTNSVDSLASYLRSDGTIDLLAGCGTRLEALSTAGAVLASASGLSGGPWSFAQVAVPGSDLAYAGNGTDTLRKWDGTTWTAPTATVDGVAGLAMPKAGVLATTALSNRLIATGFGTLTTGGPNGAATNSARVYFSEPGAPESWVSTNWIDLDPGDGDPILGAVRWSNLVLIFKSRRFYVLTGEGLTADGGATFTSRAVDTAGVGLAAKGALAVGPDAVFFMDRTGVYATTGGAPALLSDKISPVWRGSPEVYFQSGTLNFAAIGQVRMGWHDGRLYVAYPSGTAIVNDRMLVYDTGHQWWTLYDLPASALVSFRSANRAELHYGYSSGTNSIARLTPETLDDNGAAITSRWRSGWGDYGIPGEKTFRASRVWGAGAIAVGFSIDFARSSTQTATVAFNSGSDLWGDGTDSTVTWGGGTGSTVWGGGGQISQVYMNAATRGTVFSTEFANSDASPDWSVHRVVKLLRDVSVPEAVR